MPKLSIIIPVYNEKHTIHKILKSIEMVPVDKEVILVDDFSTDGTREIIINEIEGQYKSLRAVYHSKNQGKGWAIRTGIQHVSGEFVIIQDADLEYDPMDYLKLLKILEAENANVVYGSRFLQKRGVTAPWHRFVNYLLTEITNVLYASRLSDMETCYKLFRRPIIQNMDLRSEGFEIEIELTAKVLKSGEKILEAPVSYKGRSFHEGKKIGWRDGVRTLFLIFYYRFFS